MCHQAKLWQWQYSYIRFPDLNICLLLRVSLKGESPFSHGRLLCSKHLTSWEWIKQQQYTLWLLLVSLHPRRVHASNSVSFILNLLGNINMKLSSMDNAKESSYIIWLQNAERFRTDYKRELYFFFPPCHYWLLTPFKAINIDSWIIQILAAKLVSCK